MRRLFVLAVLLFVSVCCGAPTPQGASDEPTKVAWEADVHKGDKIIQVTEGILTGQLHVQVNLDHCSQYWSNFTRIAGTSLVVEQQYWQVHKVLPAAERAKSPGIIYPDDVFLFQRVVFERDRNHGLLNLQIRECGAGWLVILSKITRGPVDLETSRATVK